MTRLLTALIVMTSMVNNPETLSAQGFQIEKSQIAAHKTLHQFYRLNEKPGSSDFEEIRFSKPLNSFAFECIIIDHVNKPVGLSLKNQEKEILFQYFNDSVTLINKTIPAGTKFQKYWHHFLVNFTGSEIVVYNNGELLGRKTFLSTNPEDFLVVSGILQNEPWMNISDLLKQYSVYGKILSEDEISSRFAQVAGLIREGALPDAATAIIAEPFLSFPTTRSVNIGWETTQNSTATVAWGVSYPLVSKAAITTSGKLHNFRIDGLEPGTNYYVEVEILINSEQVHSQKMSFKTAQLPGNSFRFGIIGDTESRAFVNAKVARRIWDNRPDFFLLLGDVTDGGQTHYKDQWNFEFFTGTNALMQRVPVVPLAGNGDSDLHWFNHYFNPPLAEGFYKYSWADADFFILNSSEKDELAPGGKQYQWLENELKKSFATWKIIAFHHSPYSSDDDDFGNSYEGPAELGDKNVRKLTPLFDEYNVDFVFYGHIHCYERTWPLKHDNIERENGTVYVMTGGAGGSLEDFAPHRSWFSAKTFRGYNYLVANVFDNYFRIDVYDLNGALIDFYEKNKLPENKR